MVLHGHVNNVKMWFLLGEGGDFIIFWVIDQPNGPLRKKNQNMHLDN
jgi:hypothetical protein